MTPTTPDHLVTRFAPSPTGHLHIGGARTALFCWAFARSHRDARGRPGRFMLRIEDTDAARSSDESARGILEDLAWLGIDWDDGPSLHYQGRTIGGDERHVGPFFQAQRRDTYDRYIRQLVEQERAYPAFERAEELDAKRREATAKKQTYRYDRAALSIPLPDRLRRMASGEPHVVRLRAPDDALVVHDEVLGDVTYAAGEMDDFVIRKADGFPTYHFAVVVDDELMGVTHVLRAQEHLNNTPRHVALQRALGFRTPVYGHMPIIMNMDGSKMSKRDKARAARKAAKDAMAKDPKMTAELLADSTALDVATVNGFLAAESDAVETAELFGRHFGVALPEVEIWDFRRSGYLPEAIVNFVALLGWNPGMKTADGKDLEKFDAAFLAERFSMDRIGRGNSKFDRSKLLNFNAAAIGGLSDEQFARRWLEWMLEHEAEAHRVVSKLPHDRLLLLARALKPRAKTFREALRSAAFVFTSDEGFPMDMAAVGKHLLANDKAGVGVLREFKPRLAAMADWSPEAITGALEGFAKEKGMPNPGSIAQPLRVALTGSGVSPGLGETMAVLGRESSLRRIERCVAELGA
ncbi:MAG: glutamate--tRNA ligase [Phycisphaerales bacterium]